jgi:3-hydroxypropanoate dehydrogenase
MKDADLLDRLFLSARSQNGWLDRPVPLELVRQAFEIARLGPTSANSQPMRLVLLTTEVAKERLRPALSPGNLDKTMAAPIAAIVAYDLEFYDHFPRVFPHRDMRPNFIGKPALIEETAFRNGTLQGGYFMLALRAVGLDVGPMSGFDRAKTDEAFFPDGKWKSNFLCNIGYGDPSKVLGRLPRFEFDEITRVL